MQREYLNSVVDLASKIARKDRGRERPIKTGVRMVRHARYAIFHMAEAALPRSVFTGLLALINDTVSRAHANEESRFRLCSGLEGGIDLRSPRGV